MKLPLYVHHQRQKLNNKGVIKKKGKRAASRKSANQNGVTTPVHGIPYISAAKTIR
jgi:hypothetical protein